MRDFAQLKKPRGSTRMTIYLCNDEGKKDNYLLTLPEDITHQDINHLLRSQDHEDVIDLLVVRAHQKTRIPARADRQARLLADFTLSRGCSVQRLA